MLSRFTGFDTDHMYDEQIIIIIIVIIIISAFIMRHINRRCSANNGSLHQMLYR